MMIGSDMTLLLRTASLEQLPFGEKLLFYFPYHCPEGCAETPKHGTNVFAVLPPESQLWLLWHRDEKKESARPSHPTIPSREALLGGTRGEKFVIMLNTEQ